MSETAVCAGFDAARVRVVEDPDSVARAVEVWPSVAVDAERMREMLRQVPEDWPVEVATDGVGRYALMLRPAGD